MTVSTAGHDQYLAFQEIDSSATLNTSSAGTVKIKFGIGTAASVGSLQVKTPIGVVEFHVLYADTPFLLSLADLDALGCYYNNLENRVFNKNNTKSTPVVQVHHSPSDTHRTVTQILMNCFCGRRSMVGRRG